MTQTPQDPNNTSEESQEERGAPGSRDAGEGPGGGPVDRPSGDSDADDASGVNPQDPVTDTPFQQGG